jgi:hypothetical protein
MLDEFLVFRSIAIGGATTLIGSDRGKWVHQEGLDTAQGQSHTSKGWKQTPHAEGAEGRNPILPRRTRSFK